MLAIWASLVLASIFDVSAALWPQPRQISNGTTAIRLADDFSIHTSGLPQVTQDLNDAIQRTETYLKEDRLQILVPDRGASLAERINTATTLSALVISIDGGGNAGSISEDAIKPFEERDESYTLTVPGDGTDATLTANSSLGLFRGLTTFTQLWHEWGGAVYSLEAPIEIQDSPAYPYRGLMLDTARNFFSVDDIKATLDAMSWVKLSQFHWHVVDSQSFPLVVPGFEELSEQGAYSPTSKFSPDAVKDIVSYANARGIDVLAEIDTPGHTSIIAQSHPEHIACFQASPWGTYAAEPPSGQLRLASDETTQFTVELFKSAASLFTSPFFSTGGDEVNDACYQDDAETRAILEATGKPFDEALDDALDAFVLATHAGLKEVGKTAVVWEEMVLEHDVPLSDDALVLVWRNSANAAAVAQAGHKLVHAASDFFYLDCGGGGWLGGLPDGNSWCDPFKTWQKSYTFDPQANIAEEQSQLVVGGQHLLWTEQSSPENLHSIIWPRAAAGAEVFWTGRRTEEDLRAALPRLHDLRYRLVQRGIRAIALQPMWCALRPGLCDIDA